MHMRCIIKNQDNGVLTASCNKNFITVEPSIAELLAIQRGLQISNDLKLEKLLVQSDVMFVVDCINAVEFSTNLENIVVNCRFLLDNFKEASVRFLSRNSN